MGRLPNVGDRIASKYELVSALRVETSSTLFLARDLKTDRVVTIEIFVVEATKEDGPAIKERLARLSKLDHSSTPKVLRAGRLGDQLAYVTTEYIQGERLIDLIARHDKLSHYDAAPVIRQILASLEQAHEQGVVHGKLTTRKVLLEAVDESMMTVRVVGYGSGCIDAVGATSEADDVFAVGMIFLEMLRGSSCNPDEVETIAKLHRGFATAILLRALHHDPEKRYASAAEMAADMDRAFTALPPAVRRLNESFSRTRSVTDTQLGFPQMRLETGKKQTQPDPGEEEHQVTAKLSAPPTALKQKPKPAEHKPKQVSSRRTNGSKIPTQSRVTTPSKAVESKPKKSRLVRKASKPAQPWITTQLKTIEPKLKESQASRSDDKPWRQWLSGPLKTPEPKAKTPRSSHTPEKPAKARVTTPLKVVETKSKTPRSSRTPAKGAKKRVTKPLKVVETKSNTQRPSRRSEQPARKRITMPAKVVETGPKNPRPATSTKKPAQTLPARQLKANRQKTNGKLPALPPDRSKTTATRIGREASKSALSKVIARPRALSAQLRAVPSQSQKPMAIMSEEPTEPRIMPPVVPAMSLKATSETTGFRTLQLDKSKAPKTEQRVVVFPRTSTLSTGRVISPKPLRPVPASMPQSEARAAQKQKPPLPPPPPPPPAEAVSTGSAELTVLKTWPNLGSLTFPNQFVQAEQNAAISEAIDREVVLAPRQRPELLLAAEPTESAEVVSPSNSLLPPELPQLPEVPALPAAPPSPKVPEPPDAPRLDAVPQPPEAPEPSEAPELPKAPKLSEAPKHSESPQLSEAPKGAEAPELPEVPPEPSTPPVPEAPDATQRLPFEWAQTAQRTDGVYGVGQGPTMFVALKGPNYDEVDLAGPVFIAERLPETALGDAQRRTASDDQRVVHHRAGNLLRIGGITALALILVVGTVILTKSVERFLFAEELPVTVAAMSSRPPERGATAQQVVAPAQPEQPGTSEPVVQVEPSESLAEAPETSVEPEQPGQFDESPELSATQPEHQVAALASEPPTVEPVLSTPSDEILFSNATETELSRLVTQVLWHEESQESIVLTEELTDSERQLVARLLAYLSAASFQNALEMGASALKDQVSVDDHEELSDLMVQAYRSVGYVSSRLAACETVVSSVSHHSEWADRLAEDAALDLEGIDDSLFDCTEDVEAIAWRPDVYQQLATTGATLSEAVRVIDEEDLMREDLLRRSLLSYRLAEALLDNALLSASIEPDQRDRAARALDSLRFEMAVAYLDDGQCHQARQLLERTTGEPARYVSLRGATLACDAGGYESAETVIADVRRLVEAATDFRSRSHLIEGRVYRVHLRITSNPTNARLYLDGTQEGRVQLGRTPFNGEIESVTPTITLLVSKRRHNTRFVNVDVTSGDVEQLVRLRERSSSSSVSQLSPVD